jgi:tetratricopeptide (TPR) repeat protein
MKPSWKMRTCLLAIAVVVGGGMLVPEVGADSLAAARKHAAKANKLAAKNKCKQAMPWFNRAYRTLKDPTLLFNRAECLRKLGENNDALRDYELFLTEMPTAPNRSVVEERIASLKATAGESAGGAETTEPASAAGEKAGVAGKTAEKAPPVPVRRAEKWMD